MHFLETNNLNQNVHSGRQYIHNEHAYQVLLIQVSAVDHEKMVKIFYCKFRQINQYSMTCCLGHTVKITTKIFF